MEPCVELDVLPRPGTGPQVVVLVVILILAAAAARAGYPTPTMVISAVISAVFGAVGIRIRAGCWVPVLVTVRGNG